MEEEKKITITKDMTVGEAIVTKPEIATVLMNAGMFCFSCPASQGETLVQGGHKLPGHPLPGGDGMDTVDLDAYPLEFACRGVLDIEIDEPLLALAQSALPILQVRDWLEENHFFSFRQFP